MGLFARFVLPLILLSACALGQLPSSRCDSANLALTDCPFLTDLDRDNGNAKRNAPTGSPASSAATREGEWNAFLSTPSRPHSEHFHWGRALFESFMFLSIEQAYVVHDDYRWVVIENGFPFNHYWRDYKQSLYTWAHSGWDDGDPKLYSYLGHPIQGALTGFIQIQNDPQGRELELSNTKAYWWSRFKAFLWNSAYSTQWNIGPLSEMTVQKYGTTIRGPWGHDGKWPCTHKPCFTGVGQVDLVVTPTGGTVWLLAEDALDNQIARRVEGVTRNHFLIGVTRCALNPIRGGANILHRKRPWYRASRDASQVYFAHHPLTIEVSASRENGTRR